MGYFRRAFSCVLALAITSAACLPAHAPSSPHERDRNAFIEDLRAKTVALVDPALDDDPESPTFAEVQNHLYCSGVWIDKNMIVTANHCVEDLKIGDNVFYSTQADVDVTHQDEIKKIHMSDLVAADPAHDLALLRVLLPPSHPTSELAQNVVVGEPDATMGHPLGLLWTYSEGLVASSHRIAMDDLDMAWVQSTAPISPGNSGGGLFNEQAQLLGICSRYAVGGENLNFYVHVDYVRALWAANK